MTISIVLADDHRGLRAMLRTLLSGEPHFQVVGEAEDGRTALSLAEQLRPDVLLADVNMPAPDGIALTRILAQIMPSIRVLIVTLYDDATMLAEALEAGAAGYLPKGLAGSELINAVHIVANGGSYHPPHSRNNQVPLPERKCPENPCTLDADETQLLRLLAEGYPKSQIALQLSLAADAFDCLSAGLAAKVGSSNRVDLVRYAQARGVL